MFSQDTFKDTNCDPLSDWDAIVGSDRQCVCTKHENSILRNSYFSEGLKF